MVRFHPETSVSGPPEGGTQSRYPSPSLGSISVLVERARAGDSAAREALARRAVEALQRFASGRVPYRVRGRLDTDDLVQNAVLRGFERLGSFERRGHGSFLANLRTIVLNQIRDEARRLSTKMPHEALGEELAQPGPDPIEMAVGGDLVRSYEKALQRLRPAQREAVILRIEMGYSYDEIAEAGGLASANAARMTVARALVRLAQDMEPHGQAASD
jgi:RNA polymerase sigma-70 factor, ECF subfamily